MALNMNTKLRRTMFGLGAALLVGGWGTTRYADEQQQAVRSGDSRRYVAWIRGLSGDIPTKTIYMTGVLSMALGAGLIGLAALRTNKESR